MSRQNLANRTDELFRRERNVDLTQLIEHETKDAIDHWRDTKGKNAEQVAAIRDEFLLPAIRKLGRCCLDAIRFHNFVVYQETLEHLAWIYDLGNQRELGAQTSIETAVAIPSVHSIAELYTVGAYATFRCRLPYIRELLILQAHDHQNNLVSLWSHPHWYEYWSSDSQPNRFEQARKSILDSQELLDSFLGEQRQVTQSLSQFDFLVSFYLHLHKFHKWQYFTQFSKSHITPIIEILLRPNVVQDLGISFSLEELADFLRKVESQAAHTLDSRWHFTDWPKPVAEFLQHHPDK